MACKALVFNPQPPECSLRFATSTGTSYEHTAPTLLSNDLLGLTRIPWMSADDDAIPWPMKQLLRPQHSPQLRPVDISPPDP